MSVQSVTVFCLVWETSPEGAVRTGSHLASWVKDSVGALSQRAPVQAKDTGALLALPFQIKYLHVHTPTA